MATRINNEWEEVVDITYRVVEEQLGRGKPMDTALARTLHVAGLYEVIENPFEIVKRSDYQTF